ncbi:MAG TPA: geranylgeranyl reductase family protein [Candidatus Methylomirabilis sp.]|nr:geranylgeranyl reductase family protein [Candidatus Methylomirabilis sp.]
MAIYDVAIVGAGPAGSTAARELAKAGARVCLLDRAQFPRAKACGGALSPRILRLLPAGAEALFRSQIRRAVFTYRLERPFELRSSVPMGYMVCREEFDAWLRTAAEEAGARVLEGAAVQSIERVGSQFLLRAAGKLLHASCVVGADGANSRVAAQLFPRRVPALFVGLEAEVPGGDGEWEDTVRVDVGRYPGGYAWAFPKGDRVNVGVMMEYGRSRDLRRVLQAFVAGSPGLPAEAGIGQRAAPIAALGAEPAPCALDGVILVGDAARLADPFLGEGIYYAVRSGSLAATALITGRDLADGAGRYAKAIAETIWPDLRAASRIAALFHRMPRWWHRILSRMPAALLQHVAVLAGEQSYTGLLRHVIERIETTAGGWFCERLGLGRAEELTGRRGYY